MNRKLASIFSSISIATILIILIWPRAVQGVEFATSQEAKAIESAILRSRRIDAEAAYTFDSINFSSIYINDSRGGETPPAALRLIQEARQDFTIRANQVGYLDYMQAVIDWRKLNYELYIAELESKQITGTLTADEEAILAGKADNNPAESSQEYIPATPVIPPPPQLTLTFTAAYPQPNPALVMLIGPTPQPTSLPLISPYRGIDPKMLPKEAFEITIISIDVEGDVAKAIVSKSGVTSEMVLVKVIGQWYIAGGRLLKFEP